MFVRKLHTNLQIAALATWLIFFSTGAGAAENPTSRNDVNASQPAAALRGRLEEALDRWCRWLAGYLYRVPGTDLYTMNPTLGTGGNPYRDVAGNQFAAAAAGYWLQRAKPDDEIARPLRGLIKLALGTHRAVKTIDRPDIQIWGAGLWLGDDYHADLFVAAHAMLARGAFTSEQRRQLNAMLRWEADKQIEFMKTGRRTRPSLWPGGSCGESNAWSTALLQMARTVLPESDRQEAWRQAAIDYSLNAICMPADMTSDKIVAGKPLKERVKGANFEPGGIQVHHGFFHPGYMGWPLAYQAYAYLMDQDLPESRRNPDVYLHNWKYVFDRLKQCSFANGRFIFPAGFDWIMYGYGNTHILPAAIFAAAHYGDADAMRMADEYLRLMEYQQSLTGGCIQGSRLATLQRLKLNDFAWYEAEEGCCLAQALWVLDHVASAAIPSASTEEEYNRRNVGTYHEPNAAVIWHRDEHRWASFCWRGRRGWQAIVQPVQLPHLLKFNGNLNGIIEAVGTSAVPIKSRDAVIKVGSVGPSHQVEFFKMDTFAEGGFWSLGTIGRLGKRVAHGRPGNHVFPLLREYQALVVLPDGPSVWIDLCQAMDQLWLLRTGGLGLRLAADVFTNNEVKLTIDGREMSFGQHPHRDVWHDLGVRSITIEKLLTIHALAGEGSFQLMQKRRRPRDRSEMLYAGDTFGPEESLLAHELYFGPPAYDRPRIVSPAEWFRRQGLVLYCDPARTPAKPTGTVTGNYPCLAVHLPDAKCTVAVNFSDDKQSVDSPVARITVPPKSVKVVR